MLKIKPKQNFKEEIKRKVKEEMEMRIERETQQSKALQQYLREVNKIPPLNPKERKELAKKMIEGNKKSRKKLLNVNLKVVVSIAKKYYENFPYFTLLELIKFGENALERAFIRFDWTKNRRFSTYAEWWIKQAIVEAIFRNRNIITVGENLTIFIYRNKEGYVTNITASGVIEDYKYIPEEFVLTASSNYYKGGIHVQANFRGTDEERQKYAQELSEKWQELSKAEEEAKKLLKNIKKIR